MAARFALTAIGSDGIGFRHHPVVSFLAVASCGLGPLSASVAPSGAFLAGDSCRRAAVNAQSVVQPILALLVYLLDLRTSVSFLAGANNVPATVAISLAPARAGGGILPTLNAKTLGLPLFAFVCHPFRLVARIRHIPILSLLHYNMDRQVV